MVSDIGHYGIIVTKSRPAAWVHPGPKAGFGFGETKFLLGRNSVSHKVVLTFKGRPLDSFKEHFH
jgi:hypothetical protein